ncbi:MAG: transcriptional repressor [Clostridia bacterium]|nr:transcriptional repressor [Clostridia bacterium]
MYQRNTIQRTIILQAVKRLQNHPTADEVYAEVVKEHPSISRTTVYRNLQQLDEAGFISIRKIPGCADRYDHICANHYHVRCINCGRVADVDMEYIPDMQSRIKDGHGFVFIKHDLIFQGICLECQKQGSKEGKEESK